ncbi:hypothetical protein EDB92DRAFT_2064919 [Lactarius akahatsu]|uniref:GDP/GTP exchange factor Sec2 N-terminal domain-containing protein n=1 Tax=Lactarius akahatsu TaxID=416441 RepID=A0AAD4LII2_9AGAM|nr:hypothetical protein EDB92DRAFT_2064919 [Lactarius akahatsu]
MFSSNSRPIPQRTHSVNAVKHANYFSSVDEELRDCKRVQRQGQEEDLREALGRMIARVEEMCATLKSSYQTNADLETQLKVAQSNLKLEQANTEMLEDALKSSSLSKDVGWRRSSREVGSLHAGPTPSPPVSATIPASQSQSRTSVDESQTQQGGALESPNSDHDSRAPSPAPTATQNDSRFFRFRFTGSGRSTPTQPPHSPPSTPRPVRPLSNTVGHLTSASLPSLVGPSPTLASELEDLRGQLLAEKRNSEKITHEKKELESELESLSQALFEEANKMVAVERIKRAEAEDELQEVHAEKAALKAALRLIEEDRVRVENSHSHAPHANGTGVSPPTRSRTSSCEAVVSPRGRDSPRPPSPPPPTAQSRSQSPGGIPIAEASGALPEADGDAQDAPASPAPLYVPPPHLEEEAPASRTDSPMPLPHPHRDRLSIQRPATAPPAPPPPSAADGYPNTPWAREGLFGRRYEDEDEDEGMATELGLSVPRIVTFASPSEGEMPVPWSKW